MKVLNALGRLVLNVVCALFSNVECCCARCSLCRRASLDNPNAYSHPDRHQVKSPTAQIRGFELVTIFKPTNIMVFTIHRVLEVGKGGN